MTTIPGKLYRFVTDTSPSNYFFVKTEKYRKLKVNFSPGALHENLLDWCRLPYTQVEPADTSYVMVPYDTICMYIETVPPGILRVGRSEPGDPTIVFLTGEKLLVCTRSFWEENFVEVV